MDVVVPVLAVSRGVCSVLLDRVIRGIFCKSGGTNFPAIHPAAFLAVLVARGHVLHVSGRVRLVADMGPGFLFILYLPRKTI